MAQVRTVETTFVRPHDQDANLAVGAVAVVDGAAPDLPELKELLLQRLTPSLERADRPEFDVADHLRRTSVSRPGGDAELSRAVARVLEGPLDPGRPPWECWVIDGLQGNRWAFVIKIDHSLADGHPAAHLLARLCDDADGNPFVNDVNEAAAEHHSPRPPHETGWAPVLGALGWASGVAGAVVAAVSPRWPSGPGGTPTHRRYASVRVTITDVDAVCRKFGVTADDVALAAITEGFRAALLHRGEQPRADSLRTLAPLPGDSALVSYLPVEHDDPVQHLKTVHRRRHATPSERPAAVGIVGTALGALPTPLQDSLSRLLSRLSARGIVTLGTNAPGPRDQLRLLGRAMVRLLPIPPTAAQLGTGVAVQSYGGELVFGIASGYDTPYDVRQLAAGIELGMARLVALSQDSVLLFGREHRRRRAPRSVPRAHPSGSGQARH
jgi:WS/DGAT/MGAT family acyltransferase